MLATTHGLLQAGYSGFIGYNQPRAQLMPTRMNGVVGLITQRNVAFAAKTVTGCSARRRLMPLRCSNAVSMGTDHSDGFSEEPFWSSVTKEYLRAIKSFFSFLVDQPRQLRYIEWPTFSSTLKTATLTLVLVGLLIVALATVDSGLCYLLALLLRRKP